MYIIGYMTDSRDKRKFYEILSTNTLMSVILCLVIYLNIQLYSYVTQNFINIKVWIISITFIILFIISIMDALANSTVEQPQYNQYPKLR